MRRRMPNPPRLTNRHRDRRRNGPSIGDISKMKTKLISKDRLKVNGSQYAQLERCFVFRFRAWDGNEEMKVNENGTTDFVSAAQKTARFASEDTLMHLLIGGSEDASKAMA